MQDLSEACGLDRNLSKINLLKTKESLLGTFFVESIGGYRTLHDKLFDVLAFYFGLKIPRCIIGHGSIDIIHERFVCLSLQETTSSVEFDIPIPENCIEEYFQRIVSDWSN